MERLTDEQMQERIAELEAAEREKYLWTRISELSHEVEKWKNRITAYSAELMHCFIHIAPEAAQDGPETMGRVIREMVTELEKTLAFRTTQYETAERYQNEFIEKTLEARKQCAGLEPLAAIGRSAIRLYECQCEFADDLSYCSEWQDQLDSLIARYKAGQFRELTGDALGQNDPMGGTND